LGHISASAMASDQILVRDAVIRQAAFDHVRALQSKTPTGPLTVMAHNAANEAAC
jgi:hypothetical protein